MFRHVAVIRLGLIEILNEMVPEVPFPYDLTRRLSCRLDLDERVRQQVAVPNQFRAPAGREGFLGRLLIPDDHENVAVGQPGNIVVRKLLAVGKAEVPDDLAIPGELLHPAAHTRAAAEYRGVLADSTWAQQVSVVEQGRTQGR